MGPEFFRTSAARLLWAVVGSYRNTHATYLWPAAGWEIDEGSTKKGQSVAGITEQEIREM